MTERKQKANPDYSASAVNLTNPPEVEGLIRELENEQTSVTQLKNRADSFIPDELKLMIQQAEKKVSELASNIRLAIDEHGSYQNVEKGMYALKQRRESITYEPGLTRQTIGDQFADICIKPMVDTARLDALVKGGLVTPEQLALCGTTKESFVFIIR